MRRYVGEEEISRIAKARNLKPWQEDKIYMQALILYSLRNSQRN
ncbi:MAG: hypothetical protein QXV32_05985 [Conexivisphaerales archaeon]